MVQIITVQQAISLLLDEQLIVLDTKTLPGITGALCTYNKIVQLKDKSQNSKLCILISEEYLCDDFSIVMCMNNENIPLMLTQLERQLLLAGNGYTTIITGQNLALRLAGNAEIDEIIRCTGPLFSTSINMHGQSIEDPLSNSFCLPYCQLYTDTGECISMKTASRIIRAEPWEIVRK